MKLHRILSMFLLAVCALSAMGQAALNDGIDPVAYARNYGLDFNASSGRTIKA